MQSIINAVLHPRVYHHSSSRIFCLCLLPLIGILLVPSLALAHSSILPHIEEVSTLIKEDSNNPSLYIKRGNLYHLLGNVEQALEDYEEAQNVSDKPLSILGFLRAQAIFSDAEQMDNPGKSKKSKQTALQIIEAYLESSKENDVNINAHFLHGKILASLGNYKEAAQANGKILDILKWKAGPNYFLLQADYLVADNQVGNAIKFLDKGIRSKGNAITLEKKAIDVEILYAEKSKTTTSALKKFDKALERVSRLIVQHPNQAAFFLTKKADILDKKANINDDLDILEKAVMAYSEAEFHIQKLPTVVQNNKKIKALLKHIKEKKAPFQSDF